MTRLSLPTPGLLLAAGALLLLGCKPAPKVAQYEAPADPKPAPEAKAAPTPAPVAQATAPAAPSAPAMQATPAMKAETAGFGEPKWPALPAGWSVGPENSMRKATFVIAGKDGAKAEVAVTVFPGNVGGTTANVNRWRGQLGLAPASEQDIAAAARPAKVGADAGQRFVMTSADGRRATDAVQVAKNGATWFFKLSGDAAVVSAAGDAFAQFLSSSQLP